MKEQIKGVELRTFLKDYEVNSTIEFLEKGKEKSDLIESAKKRGILVEGSRDLGLLKTVYCFTDQRNANGAVVPSKEFQKKIPQIIGKPMNKNHERETILGYYIDYKYILKENKAITYAVFFKSYHPDEWKEAKALQKKGKLSSSFEIYADEDKRIDKTKGDYILKSMELAGGALIFEDENNKPAFKNAKVLSIAKKELPNYVQDKYLVFASKSIKAKSEDIITADWALDEVKKNADKLAKEKEAEKIEKVVLPEEKPKEEVKEDVKPEEPKEEKVEDNIEDKPIVPTIKCSNCEEEIEIIEGQVQIKCPKCLSILDSTGKVKYPPQIQDFKLSCSCGMRDWLILENNSERAKLRCQSCAKEVDIKFKVAPKETNADENLKNKLHFLYQSFATCLQCGHNIPIIGTSKIDAHTLTCPKCGLHFNFDKVKSEKYRQIEEINEIPEDKIEKSSEKGGDKKMEIDEKIVEAVEKQAKEVESTIEEKIVEPKEEKVEASEVKAEEVKKAKEVEEVPETFTPKAEEKHIRTYVDVIREENKAAEKAEQVEAGKKAELAIEISDEEVTVTTDIEALEKEVVNEVVEQNPELAKRGDGKGNGGKPQGDGGADKCVCPKCGYEVKHKKGTPCVEIKCPKCGKSLIGKNIKAKKSSSVRKAVKKIMNLKKEIKLAKTSTEIKEKELKEGIKKVASQLIEAKAEIKKIKAEATEKIEFYSENAKEIIKRKIELGEDSAKDLSDNDILDDDKFAKAKLEKENTLLRASVEKGNDNVADKISQRDSEWFKEQQLKVDNIAFGRKSEKKGE